MSEGQTNVERIIGTARPVEPSGKTVEQVKQETEAKLEKAMADRDQGAVPGETFAEKLDRLSRESAARTQKSIDELKKGQ